MKDEWIHYCSPMPLHSQKEVYEWLAQQLDSQGTSQKVQIIQALLEREATGNIQIEEGIVLPHIENEDVMITEVFILPLEKRIREWSNEISQVELVIAVFLAPNESIEVKRQLVDFIRHLADETILGELKKGKKQVIKIESQRRNEG